MDILKQWWLAFKILAASYTSPFAEAVKEVGREVILAIPSLLLMFLPIWGITERTFLGALVYLIVRASDKYLHEKNKMKGAGENLVLVSRGISPI